MKLTSILIAGAVALGAAACGEQSSTGSSADRKPDAGPKAQIEPSPGTKGPGKVDSSGGNEAKDGAATKNRTFKEQVQRGSP